MEGYTQARFTHVATPEGHMVLTGRDGVLMRCEDEPIHIPGAVQTFGCLIVVREESDGSLQVRQASEVSLQNLRRRCEQFPLTSRNGLSYCRRIPVISSVSPPGTYFHYHLFWIAWKKTKRTSCGTPWNRWKIGKKICWNQVRMSFSSPDLANQARGQGEQSLACTGDAGVPHIASSKRTVPVAAMVTGQSLFSNLSPSRTTSTL